MDAAQRDIRYLTELQNIETILKEMGHTTKLLRKSPQIPHHALLTRVPMPEGKDPIEMALTFYPVEPNTTQYSMLLQYFIEIPLAFEHEALEQYRQLLPDLNDKTVLGHFGITSIRATPHYRYVQTLPLDRPITKADVADTIILVSYTPALFSDLLTALATKNLDANAARNQLHKRYIS